MPIGINIEKAKEIHKDYIRKIRNPILNEKDVEYMKALEIGDDQKAMKVVEEKQKLRDVTLIVNDVELNSNDINEISEQLKQVWDENLLGPNPLLNS